MNYVGDCFCKLGYYGENEAPCTACPNGKYGTGSDRFRTTEAAGCTACPAGKKGAGGSGYVTEETGCVACASGTYTTDPGSVACLSCPRGKRYVAADKPCSNCSGSLGPTTYWHDNCGTRGCWSDANHYFNGPSSCGCYGTRGGGVCEQSSTAPYVPICTNSCPVGFCNNLGNNQYWSGTRVSAGTTARNSRVSATSCARATCTNALKTQYYPGPSGDVRDRFSATSCPVQNCTNALNNQYYSGLGGSSAPTTNSCPVSPCTNTPARGYYWSGPGLTTQTSCAVSRCTNPIQNNQYYSSNGGTTDSCQVQLCQNTLPDLRYWSANGFDSPTGCSTAPCANLPANAVYEAGALNLNSNCSYLCNAGYYRDTQQDTCRPCPLGTFTSVQGAVGACTPCTAGVHYPNSNVRYLTVGEGQTGCYYECNAGFTADVRNLQCVSSTSSEENRLTIQKFAIVGDLVDNGNTRLVRLNLTRQTTETLVTLPYTVLSLALDASGDYAYFSTTQNLGAFYKILLQSPYEITLEVGSETVTGFVDGPFVGYLPAYIYPAYFNRITQIATPRTSTFVLIMDQNNLKIRKIDFLNQRVDTLISTNEFGKFVPYLAISLDSAFFVYVQEPYWRILRTYMNSQYYSVNTLTGNNVYGPGYVDGLATQAKFQLIKGLAISSDNSYVYVSHDINETDSVLRVVDLGSSPRTVRTLIASDSRIRQAMISTNPSSGKIWLASLQFYTVTEVTVAADLSGVNFSVVYGQPGTKGVLDDTSMGSTHTELFNSPQWVSAWVCGRKGYECDKSDGYVLPCIPGKFSDGISGCQDCQPGSFSATFASAQCTACGAGTFTQYLFSTQCYDCTPSCSQGYYFAGCGGSSPGSCPQCQRDCSPGFSRSNCAGTSPGTCLACSSPPAVNQYYLAECSVAQCQASPLLGYYWNSTGGCQQTTCSNKPGNSTYAQQENLQQACAYACDAGYTGAACDPCQPGTFGQDQQCAPCQPGTFQPSQASTACLACAAGTFSDSPGSVQCQPCPQGTYANTQGGQQCAPCEPGRVSAQGSRSCTICLPGYAALPSNLAQCQACPPGSYSSEFGAVDCTPCAVGTASNATAALSCPPCARNSISIEEGALSCTPCENGLFTSDAGQSVCTVCPAGSYITASDCVPCPRGHVSEARSSSCSPCEPGTFRSAAFPSACQACPVGHVSPQASEACARCQPGTFKSAQSQESCQPCPPGAYSSAFASLQCYPCLLGYTAQQGSSACSVCLAGTYHDPTASNATCVPCAPGLYSLRAALACLSCPAGSYAPSPVGPCVPCAPNTFAPLPGLLSCSPCPPGYYQNATGSTACKPCDPVANATFLPHTPEEACPFECPQNFVQDGLACRALRTSTRFYLVFAGVVARPYAPQRVLAAFRQAVAAALRIDPATVFATTTRPRIQGSGRRLLQQQAYPYGDTVIYFVVEADAQQDASRLAAAAYSDAFQAALNDASKAQDLPALVVRSLDVLDNPSPPPPPPQQQPQTTEPVHSITPAQGPQLQPRPSKAPKNMEPSLVMLAKGLIVLAAFATMVRWLDFMQQIQ